MQGQGPEFVGFFVQPTKPFICEQEEQKGDEISLEYFEFIIL